MPLFKSRIKRALAHRREQGLTRQLKVLENSNGPLLTSEGSSFINFSSNDYLGLANDPELVNAWQTGLPNMVLEVRHRPWSQALALLIEI